MDAVLECINEEDFDIVDILKARVMNLLERHTGCYERSWPRTALRYHLEITMLLHGPDDLRCALEQLCSEGRAHCFTPPEEGGITSYWCGTPRAAPEEPEEPKEFAEGVTALVAGARVSWSSQAAGTQKVKNGRIRAIVRAGQDITAFLSGSLTSAQKRFDVAVSIRDRALVEVCRGEGKQAWFYAPPLSLLRVLRTAQNGV